MTNTPLITIDTDNAVIRIYLDRARAAGLSDDGIIRLRLDAYAIANTVSGVSGARFDVVPDIIRQLETGAVQRDVTADNLTDEQIRGLAKDGAVQECVAADALSADITRRIPRESESDFVARKRVYTAARTMCADVINARARDELTSITSIIDAALRRRAAITSAGSWAAQEETIEQQAELTTARIIDAINARAKAVR